ncbi:MAG: immunoglobulin domain-containing protein, partial [Mycobacterium sp.]|nr:immunoglobulin domain-containing protein [Mycobacterium sp.]
MDGAIVTTKPYDRNTTAAITGASLQGVIAPDDVTLVNADSGTFDTKDVGTTKTVTTAMDITGGDAGNYSLTQPALTSEIDAIPVTVANAVVTSKSYDGTTVAAITGASLSGVIEGDSVTLDNADNGTFADPNVNTGIAVSTAPMTLGGTDAQDYTLTQPTLAGDITAASLAPSITASDKVYDGNTGATITGRSLIGTVYGNDDVNLSGGTATFDTASVGNAKTVTATGLSLIGEKAGNYSLNTTTATALANITSAPLTVAANSTTKVYGTTLNFVGTEFTHGTLASGDSITSVTLTSSGAAASADEGTYDIIPSSANGTGLDNYDITYVKGTLTVQAGAPTVVSLTPIDQTNSASTTASFAVTVTGPSSYTNYQWVKITATSTNTLTDGGNISGSTSDVLTIANVLAADQAVYAVTIANAAGSVTTNATLVVNDPAILVQPVGVTNNLGGNVSFSVTAAGSSTLYYQWQQGNVTLPGQTGSTLTLNNIADSAAGNYTVIVSNLNGVVTSAAATLYILHPPSFVSQPASLTVNQGDSATFNVSMNGRSPFSYQWYHAATSITPWLPVTGNHVTLNNVTANDAGAYTVQVTNADGSATSQVATLTVIVPPSITGQPQGRTNNAGTVAVFGVTNTGSASSYYWYKNSSLLSDSAHITGSSTPWLTINDVHGADIGVYSVVVSNAAAIATSVGANFVVIDPIITSQPVSVTTNAGAPASFTVSAYGTSPQYQWLKGGVVIPTATAATYTIAHVADGDVAGYSVIVSNAFGSVTSAPAATLTVIDPAFITGQPQSLTTNAGSTATFTVSFTGTSPAIQWYKGGTAIGTATSATLTLLSVSQNDAVDYTVVLTNAAGSVTSAPVAHLTVIDPPLITGQPQSRTNNAGTTATFSVTNSGSASVYQWFLNATNALVNGLQVSGADTATLTLSNVLGGDAGAYSVVVSN